MSGFVEIEVESSSVKRTWKVCLQKQLTIGQDHHVRKYVPMDQHPRKQVEVGEWFGTYMMILTGTRYHFP